MPVDWRQFCEYNSDGMAPVFDRLLVWFFLWLAVSSLLLREKKITTGGWWESY